MTPPTIYLPATGFASLKETESLAIVRSEANPTIFPLRRNTPQSVMTMIDHISELIKAGEKPSVEFVSPRSLLRFNL